MFSQVSAVLPNAFSSRMAISGEIAVFSFRTADRLFRATPRILAASVTVNSNGSRQASRIRRPGWILHTHYLTSPGVINPVNIPDTATIKLEDDSPVARYPDIPEGS